MNNNPINQINITYSPEQDRLLLRANTEGQQEYRIWLTRRFSALLMQVLDKQINQAGGMQKLASEHETLAHLKQGAFDKAYQDDVNHSFPLGEAGILGYQINSGPGKDGGATVQLLPQDGQGLNLSLNDSMLYLIYNLLEQALMQADWNLGSASSQREAVH